MATWYVVDRATNKFVLASRRNPSSDYDASTTLTVAAVDDKTPDFIGERYDATSPTLRRPATTVERRASDLAAGDLQAARDRAQDEPIVAAFIDFLPGIIASITNGTFNASVTKERLLTHARQYRRNNNGG